MADEKKQTIIFDSLQRLQDENNAHILKNSNSELNQELMKNMIRHAAGTIKKGKGVPRLAFTEDPLVTENYAGIYKLKKGLIPDQIIKQIRNQNFLVAGILRARGNALSMMGHARRNRFDIGIDLDIKPEFKEHIEPEQMVKIQERMDRFLKILINCGHTDGLKDDERINLPEFLDIQTRNGLAFGRFATEIIYQQNGQGDSTDMFHRFRAIDVGSIYRSVKKGEAAEGIRRSSIKLLEQATGIKLDADHLKKDEYAWVQVIQGTPRQAFTSKEMVVYTLYPSSDIEHNGYPLTPIDTVMTSITTHMSIEVYNKLYFQNGRAARGMLVVNSDEIDQSVIDDIKQQFNASINDVTNSFRTPIFGVSKTDKVEWISTQPQKKDGEFQFLFDQTTRNILSAFNMSPDELPGFTHLSRGTNQQGLSESNNEFKLNAARDTGIRPLLLKMQDFINETLFTLIDPELSQLCQVQLAGFDAETKQQESTRLQQDMPVHYTYDNIMDETEKELVGPSMSGNMPFNERYLAALDKYQTVGNIIGHFNDSPAAMVDPILRYKRDEFWFKWLETLGQANPNALAAYTKTRSDSMQVLKMYLKDYLDESDIES
jgi:hypothetical protein